MLPRGSCPAAQQQCSRWLEQLSLLRVVLLGKNIAVFPGDCCLVGRARDPDDVLGSARYCREPGRFSVRRKVPAIEGELG